MNDNLKKIAIMLTGVFLFCSPIFAEFTIVHLPDTQKLVDPNESTVAPDLWVEAAEWIAANKGTLNIKLVISAGDMVDNAARPRRIRSFHALEKWEAGIGGNQIFIGESAGRSNRQGSPDASR